MGCCRYTSWVASTCFSRKVKPLGIPLRPTLQAAPFPALAAAVCLAAAIVGVAVLDDYGVGWDEKIQRQIATWNAQYVLGDSDALPNSHEAFYGMAVEMPLLLAERALGLSDSRDIHLMRHLLTHLFFILGAFFCGLLAHRLFGSRGLAVLAMLMFLLHPRLYAHSFFNSKDVPFAAMFMIALHLTHRAFRKETTGAFALCGLAAGLACNLRVFGLLLLPAVLAMRALDLGAAGDGAERRRVLARAGAFTAAALATMYVLHPYYWTDPLRFVEGLQVLSQHPTLVSNWFQGEEFRSDEVPPHFVPTWFAITAPPVTLLLAGIGAAVICATGLAHPRRALRNGGMRFRLLLLGCAALPVAAVIALRANVYDDWRHLYFLWAPVSLLAAAGLHWLAAFGEPRPLRRRLALVGGGGATLRSGVDGVAAPPPAGLFQLAGGSAGAARLGPSVRNGLSICGGSARLGAPPGALSRHRAACLEPGRRGPKPGDSSGVRSSPHPGIAVADSGFSNRRQQAVAGRGFAF